MTLRADRPDRGRANPYAGDFARANSAYAALESEGPTQVPEPEALPSPLATLIGDRFRDLVKDAAFPCLGAKAAFRGGRYRIGTYERLASPTTTAGLARDLSAFAAEQDSFGNGFSTFVATFAGPTDLTELDFERLLWAQLQALHDGDRIYHSWDPSVTSDPEDPAFSFSFAGRAFFVVGLHAASSRQARRFPWPTLVFNAHHQFQRLREQGHFRRMQELIRSRDRALQGTVNVNLSDFGERSEARQYSGRPVGPDWRCPFQTRAEGVGDSGPVSEPSQQ